MDEEKRERNALKFVAGGIAISATVLFALGYCGLDEREAAAPQDDVSAPAP